MNRFARWICVAAFASLFFTAAVVRAGFVAGAGAACRAYGLGAAFYYSGSGAGTAPGAPSGLTLLCPLALGEIGTDHADVAGATLYFINNNTTTGLTCWVYKNGTWGTSWSSPVTSCANCSSSISWTSSQLASINPIYYYNSAGVQCNIPPSSRVVSYYTWN
jgi:hypothetical protein